MYILGGFSFDSGDFLGCHHVLLKLNMLMDWSIQPSGLFSWFVSPNQPIHCRSIIFWASWNSPSERVRRILMVQPDEWFEIGLGDSNFHKSPTNSLLNIDAVFAFSYLVYSSHPEQVWKGVQGIRKLRITMFLMHSMCEVRLLSGTT